jgi:hypothetical protein
MTNPTVPPEIAAVLAAGVPAPAGLSEKERAAFDAFSSAAKMGNRSYEVAPGRRQQLLPLLMAHRARCLKHEPGTLQFEVLAPREDDTRALLYEVYGTAPHSTCIAPEWDAFLASMQRPAAQGADGARVPQTGRSGKSSWSLRRPARHMAPSIDARIV